MPVKIKCETYVFKKAAISIDKNTIENVRKSCNYQIVQKLFIKTTKQKEIVDITSVINDLLRKNLFDNGLCYLFVTHTTCALTTADLDPGTDSDMLNAFDAMVPKLDYKHPHDPSHVGDHILSTLIGTSLYIPVQSASLVLGAYQRVVLVEFNGPKDRHLVVNYLAEE